MTSAEKKLELWKSSLLDLTLRNPFLNMKRAPNIPITLTSSHLDEIAGERSFTLLSAPPSEADNGHLYSVLSESELAKTVKKLCRTYKNNSREIGAHTLYLAVGTLEWTKASDDTVYHAPLVLVPADINRKGRDSYSFTFRLEDAAINITLIQFLKREYGQDIDMKPVSSAKNILRHIGEFKKAVSGIKDCSVSERCCIGIFSFANIAIWNDLCVRGAKILEHKLVKSIISGCPWKEDTSEECGTPCVYLPLPVDSSQKAAIESAAKGESFVLHGPPGTGKTNVLCNVAASQMGNGRSTLITSEKAAALEVVHERLEKLGLSPFSLLITPQTTTKQVLHHLEEALNLQPRESSSLANYAKAADSFESLCEKADAYIRFINEKREQFGGMSMHELIEAYEEVKNAPDVYLSLHNTAPQAKVQQEAAISALIKADCPPLGNLRGIDFFNLDSGICRKKLPKAVAGYKAALYEFSNALNSFSAALDIFPSSRAQVKEAIELAKAISFLGELPIDWLKHLDNNEYFAGVYETCKHFKESADIRLELEQLWLPSFLEIDVEFTLKSYYSIMRMPLIIRHIELLKLAKDLRPYSRGRYVLTSDIEGSLKLLKEYRCHRSIAEKLLEIYSVDESSDYAAIIEKLEILHEYKELIGDKLEFVVSIDSDMVKELLAAWKDLVIEKHRFYVIWDVPESISDEPCWIDNQLRLCDNLEDADAVGRFIDAAKGMLRVNLGNLFDEYALGKVETADLLPIYRKQLYKCWIDTAFLSNSDFNHFSYEEVLDHISRQSAQLRLSACEEVYNHAVGRIAEFKESNPSEVTLLRKAILKGGRGLSIRELLSMIPTLVQVLYPCILCSPSAAAKYLPADMTFDTVITDESSQLRTSRAVGIISRGKNVVISGDEKQLPPTSFFEPRYDDSDLRLEEMDMDNILEDFLVLGPHEHYLKFHYRSCSQLIGFANHSFYNDGLITVPSASIKPVTSLVKANGVYERQRNGAEVAAAVREVIHRYQVKDTRTIGIICMNIQQQAYITEMLDIARENDPRFDKWLDESKEPLFIKNLETVQGDERDSILITGGFGPDSNGNIHQTIFGALCHQHGWRRLNTAITRARKELVVFSSISPEDIKISTSTSRGVMAYRDFLLYASEGGFYGNNAAHANFTSHNIRDSVCAELTELGFRTVPNVGSGPFQVDIAVTHPAAGDEYSVAVLISDGRINVIDTLTVSSMLVESGWKCVKIISPVAWFSDPESQIDQILKGFGDHYYAIRKGIKCCIE